MSSEINGSKTQIILAVLSLIGVLGGALFANWDKLFPKPDPPPTPTPVIVVKTPEPSPSTSDRDGNGATPSPEINISGFWRDATWVNNTSQITQQGSAFKFTARGVACGGRYFESSGSGTITGNRVESHYESNFSQGDCSGTVSPDGRRMTSICTDTVCRQFPSIAVKQ